MLAFTKKTNSASRAWLVAGAFWFAVGTTYGMFSAIHLMAPDLFGATPGLVFGRTRPIHVNTVIFGFASSVLWGCTLYAVPALLRTRLWSERTGWLSMFFWNATVLSGPITFSMGYSQGREYAEYIWIFDCSLVVSLLLMILNLVMTIVNRREKLLYVTVWYAMGTALWMAGVYPIGNVMWQVPSGALPGLLDSVFLWFYGHNLVGLLLTPLATGVAYFVVPRVTGTPLYSHTLSLLGFWGLVLLYSHIGGHHILQAPIPNWLKTVSIVDSMGMIIPVFIVLFNLWMTARGRFGSLWNDIGARWILTGLIWYIFTCTQGPLQSLPILQKITHFSNWTIGHAHIAVLGFSGFIAIGGLWYVLPLVTGRQLYSRKLASLQYGLALLGITGFFVVLTIAGLLQGTAWYHGQIVYEVLPYITPYMISRAMLGVLIVMSAYIGLYNVLMTIWKGRPLMDGTNGRTHR